VRDSLTMAREFIFNGKPAEFGVCVKEICAELIRKGGHTFYMVTQPSDVESKPEANPVVISFFDRPLQWESEFTPHDRVLAIDDHSNGLLNDLWDEVMTSNGCIEATLGPDGKSNLRVVIDRWDDDNNPVLVGISEMLIIHLKNQGWIDEWEKASKSESAFPQRQLDEARENLQLVRERKSQYVLETDIPLQLIKEERGLLKRIEELEQCIDEQE
jgi:hypothetical protein